MPVEHSRPPPGQNRKHSVLSWEQAATEGHSVFSYNPKMAVNMCESHVEYLCPALRVNVCRGELFPLWHVQLSDFPEFHLCSS